MGRRVRQVTFARTGAGTVDQVLTTTQDLRFMYDGWHMIAQIKAVTTTSGTTFTPQKVYVWGLNISGTRGGAGGIGGLLAWYDRTAGKLYAPYYDGRRNVQAIYGMNDSHVISEYEYDQYGKNIRKTGYVKDATTAVCGMVAYDPISNPFRYQTKWRLQDSTGINNSTGYSQFDLYDYVKRWYNPKHGRFINRDPIAEQGGLNLYAFVGNNPVNQSDMLGMVTNSEYNKMVDSFMSLYDTYSIQLSKDDSLIIKSALSSGNFDWYYGDDPFDYNHDGINNRLVTQRGCNVSCVELFDSAIETLKNTYGSWNNTNTGGDGDNDNDDDDDGDDPSTPVTPGVTLYNGYNNTGSVFGSWTDNMIDPRNGMSTRQLQYEYVNSAGWATWGDAVSSFIKWATGTLPTYQEFGPDTRQTLDMMNASGVQRALDFFYIKNANNGPYNYLSVENYDAGFGLKGLIESGVNPTQQFVGNYRVDIYPVANGMISIQLSNTTSMSSFLYGWGPSWNQSTFGPGGNASQLYYWTQPIKNVSQTMKRGGAGGTW